MKFSFPTDITNLQTVIQSLASPNYSTKKYDVDGGGPHSIAVAAGWLSFGACAGGGGGGGTSGTVGGGGGGSGASVVGARIWIPTSRTLTVTLGAPGLGAGQSGGPTVTSNGGAGGVTTIANLPVTDYTPGGVLTLLGGGGGFATGNGGMGAYDLSLLLLFENGTTVHSTAGTSTAYISRTFMPAFANADAQNSFPMFGGTALATGGLTGHNNTADSALRINPHPANASLFNYCFGKANGNTGYGGYGAHSWFGVGGNGTHYASATAPVPGIQYATSALGYGAGGGGKYTVGGTAGNGSGGYFEWWQ